MPRPLAAVLLLVALPACGGDHDTHGGGAEGRVVTVTATDALRFEPSAVTAKAGEKVTFRISNNGKARHEFVIGDDAYHASHRATMASASPSDGHGHHGDGGSSVDLPPGSSTDLTITMPDAPPRFACYVDRHADAGMTGTVTYS